MRLFEGGELRAQPHGARVESTVGWMAGPVGGVCSITRAAVADGWF